MSSTRRVAITGYGIVCCLGNDRETVLDSLRKGRSGIEFRPERKEMGFRSGLSARMEDPGPPPVHRRVARQMGPSTQLATHAAFQAIEHAGLADDALRSDRAATVIGHAGNIRDVYQQCHDFKDKKLTLKGTSLQRVMNDTVSANMSILFGTRGYSFTVSAACATGAAAIGQAFQLIHFGLQDIAICGGTMEDSWEYACNFDALKAFSMREGEPERASRPFDRDRDGLVPSWGSSMLILEELESARARGATIHAELTGYCFASDAKDMTAPSGDGGKRAIARAVLDSGLTPDQVDYINAHATATPVGDAVEARVIAELFGRKPYVSSTKSMTGHEAGAAGSNELVYTLLMMANDFVAPSINLDHIDPECAGINLVANEALEAEIEVAASNSFGFGGVNTCLVIKKSPA